MVRQNVFDSQSARSSCGGQSRVGGYNALAADGVEHSSRFADYRLDGNRFVDVQHVTVQFEHGANARLLRVVEPVNDVEPVFDRAGPFTSVAVWPHETTGARRERLGL